MTFAAIVGDTGDTGDTGDNGAPDASAPSAASVSHTPSPSAAPTASPSLVDDDPSPGPGEQATPSPKLGPPFDEEDGPLSSGGAALPEGDATMVERIVDGDTLYLTGLPERARLIGIDTPETEAPNTPVECFGPEATAHLQSLVPPGTEVVVTWDVERTDRFGRPLVYLHRAADGLFVNEAMLVDGYAQMVTYPPNVAHIDTFGVAQADARGAGRGLWSADCGDDTPMSAPNTTARSGRHCRRRVQPRLVTCARKRPA